MNYKYKEDTSYIALDMRVIAVAVANIPPGDWACYIGACPGNNHEKEWEEIRHHGSKLPREVAELLFPRFANTYRWRY